MKALGSATDGPLKLKSSPQQKFLCFPATPETDGGLLLKTRFTLIYSLVYCCHHAKIPFIIMALSDYFASKFLFIATANVFNVIALISAILLLLDPILFVAHTGYNFYHLKKAEKNPPPEKGRGKSRAEVNPYRTPPYTAWWKWYVVTGTIHLLDAWFFRTFIPFLERARTGIETPADDLRDLVDIARLLWGIVRSLSILVIA